MHWYLMRGAVLLVVATVVAGGLPVIAATWSQLERQTWERVEKDQAVTRALYASERERLEAMATLIAERPMLCTLIERRDTAALTAYLGDLRPEATLSGVLVVTDDQPPVSIPTAAWSSLANLTDGWEAPSADFVALNDPDRLLIVALAQMEPPPGCEPPPTRVIVFHTLDDVFMRRLEEQTGLAQSLIMGNRRVATSLPVAPDWPLDVAASARVTRTGVACCTRGASDREIYYVGLAPLTDHRGRVVALSEIALPGRAIRAHVLGTVALLLGIGLGAAGGGSLLAILLARHIVDPLKDLTSQSVRLGQGDLDTPIVVASQLAEINQLSTQISQARRRLRHALNTAKRDKQRVERFLQATHEGIVTLDERGRITSMSAEAEQVLGYSVAEVLDEPHTEIFRPAPGDSATLADLFSPPPDAPPVQRVTVQDACGRPVTLDVSWCWLDPDLPPDRLRERVVVLRDVSEEAALDRLRSNFLATVSHEFRTPLSAVVATAELLAEEGPNLSTEELTELISALRMGTLTLQTLVDNLLESASIEAGRFRISRRLMRLEDVLNAAAQTMSPLLKRRNQVLEIAAIGALPALRADPDRLTQAVINLLSNASKFSPMGTPITLTVGQSDGFLRVAVQDSGPGLPSGRYADLFKRFVAGPPSRGAQYGIGLGLSVVKAIVEAHGGEVGAQNRPEGGAEVWFTLPLEQPGD